MYLHVVYSWLSESCTLSCWRMRNACTLINSNSSFLSDDLISHDYANYREGADLTAFRREFGDSWIEGEERGGEGKWVFSTYIYLTWLVNRRISRAVPLDDAGQRSDFDPIIRLFCKSLFSSEMCGKHAYIGKIMRQYRWNFAMNTRYPLSMRIPHIRINKKRRVHACIERRFNFLQVTNNCIYKLDKSIYW